LRLAAMIAMSALRFAKDTWRQEDGVQPLTHFIDQAFDLIGEASKQGSSP
jgi:hypothetical protein